MTTASADREVPPPGGEATVGSVPAERFSSVRALTEQIAAPLSAEDQTAQSMPDVSPTKWHRAHTTWFFEEFVLVEHMHGYRPFDPAYRYLFNSYYDAVGPRHPRSERGSITRPGVAEVGEYRARVDDAMCELLAGGTTEAVAALVELGLQHEQQHQELALMDIKHVLSRNVLDPRYRHPGPATAAAPRAGTKAGTNPRSTAAPARWWEHSGGRVEVGFAGDGFCFDNERPRHAVELAPFALASEVVTAGEVWEFVADGGYTRPELWLSDGWSTVVEQGWDAPMYWRSEGPGEWSVFTLTGRRSLDPAEPACHLSYYEADAFARWAGARLPTEAEWEALAVQLIDEACPPGARRPGACRPGARRPGRAEVQHDTGTGAQAGAGGTFDLDALHPQPADTTEPPERRLLGGVWEWTASAYLPYPGFRCAAGAVGEYNGKFMVNQHVLRGGSCLTPPGHARPTYRNFFPPAARWAMSGLRLARDLDPC